MAVQAQSLVRAARADQVREAGCLTVQVAGHTLALFSYGDRFYAVDNRCPHMGFPLDRGTVKDGILTCHWHHARFDLASGGTFDQFADDVPTFPVEIRGDEVWVDLAPRADEAAHQRRRLRDGLAHNISLVVAKAVIALAGSGAGSVEPFRIGLAFGARNRAAGWGRGLTMHTCFMNLLPALGAEDRPRALYLGLSAVANDTAGSPPRFAIDALPGALPDLVTLKRWLRGFVEMRDEEGAERCLASALAAGASAVQMADMLFAAATDHRYIDGGHTLDFTNKALEALDIAGWEHAGEVLPGLASGYAGAARMEESNAWRNPVDLVAILEEAFEQLPAIRLAPGSAHEPPPADSLVHVLLDDDPRAIAGALLEALRAGTSPQALGAAVAYAAALRIARLHTSNEFGDWDTALHTFTFASAVHAGLQRAPSAELLRGVFDAAMSVYLDRFLNLPPARLPEPGSGRAPDLSELEALLDRQQQVDAAGELVARYLYAGGAPEALLRQMGRLLLREDRDFHTIQAVEAAFRQYAPLRGTPAGVHVLVAAARYLAAHAPSMRAQGQTFLIAQRLARGERLFE